MILDILIPTYNRCEDLLKNLIILRKLINEENLLTQIQIIISDNGSADNTEAATYEFIKENKTLSIKYFRLPKNLGLEQNVVHVLSKATSSFVIFLGDDDFLQNGYLTYCINKINTVDLLGCILPGINAVDEKGNVTEQRPATFEEIEAEPGFNSLMIYSHLGHQMSGVVLKRENLLDDYVATDKYRNIYLFIYFVSNRILNYKVIYAPKFKTLVSTYNAKDWSYNQVGLLNEVYKSYYPFIKQLGEHKVVLLILRFTIIHSYRIGFNKWRIFQTYKKLILLLKEVEPLSGLKIGLVKLFVKEQLSLIIKG